MRTTNVAAVLLGMLSLGATAGVACRSLPDCAAGDELHGLMCTTTVPSTGPGGTGGGGIGGSGVGGDGGMGGGTGGGGGVPIACIPNQSGEVVKSDCGIFVSSSLGADGNPGTLEQPLKTLSAAVDEAVKVGKPVYACAEELMEAFGTEVPAGVTVFGGLDCSSGWTYVGEFVKTVVTAPPGLIPIRLNGGKETTRFEDLHVLAESAVLPSGSSIAVLVNEGASVSFARSLVEAGDAMSGADGAPYMTAAPNGDAGLKGGNACSAAMVAGGASVANSCGANPDSAGGKGGGGTNGSATPGESGLPDYGVNAGAAEGAMACTPGGAGMAGATPGGPGTDGVGMGTISATGYMGAAGTDGGVGEVGQGGGGGGGSKGSVGLGGCLNAGSAGGAGGGSGGAGGCGGAGGKGGGFGGSSIAIVSLSENVSFEETLLVAKTGGNGGVGGPPQEGGQGGNGAAGGTAPGGLDDGCAGGAGGDGAEGGEGGNGVGGHSLGIAYRGAAAPSLTGVMITIGVAGIGGGTAGAGVAQDTLEFP